MARYACLIFFIQGTKATDCGLTSDKGIEAQKARRGISEAGADGAQGGLFLTGMA